MKDAPKTISERATRFLAVDMKDRLKSAFVRNSSGPSPAPDAPRADDLPDFSAIFAQRAQSDLRKTSEQTQLAEPMVSVTMKNPARQLAHDIEEAEIVIEPRAEAAASPAWEAVSLKTRKVEAVPESRLAAMPEIAPKAMPATSKVMPNVANYAPATVPSMPSRSALRGSMIDSTTMAKTVAPQPTLISKQDAATPPKDDARPLASEATSSKYEEPVAQKSKFRFFNDSAESVRLKVEKRPEERPAVDQLPVQAAESATSAESKSVQAMALAPETAATSIVREPDSVEQSNGVVAMNEAAAVAPATLEHATLKLQKENASMDAKGHETDNGAAPRADANATAPAIAIERNSKFSGQLRFSGAVAIDGQVDGELVAERIVVHEGGVVNATIEGNFVVIAGTVKGDIYARSELEILPSGVVNGSISAPAISVRRGGRVEGRCAIGVPRA